VKAQRRLSQSTMQITFVSFVTGSVLATTKFFHACTVTHYLLFSLLVFIILGLICAWTYLSAVQDRHQLNAER
jgi:Flp pilus assembly protein TadB